MKKSKLDRTPSPFDEVGVDVAKLKLDISIGTNLFTVPNTDKGIAGLLDQIQPATGTRVSLEATGAYTRNLIKACLGRQIPVSLLNARYVRNYARCSGQLAKTDAIDARVIAGYAKDYDPKLLRPEWVAQEALQQRHKRLDGLIRTRAERKTSLEFYSEPDIRAEIKREMAALTRRIDTYKKKIAEMITSDEAKRAKQQAMETIIGVGNATSTTLIVHFPELGELNRGQAAALAGLAPMNRDSGPARGRRTIQAGRCEPRKALYMAALTAAHRNPMFIPFYKKLKAAGKPVKVALTAVARKLLILINTTIKNLLENNLQTT